MKEKFLWLKWLFIGLLLATAVTVVAQQPVNVTNSTVAVTQSGTFTVQPGNTANTTAWLVTGTGGTFPATESGTWTVQPGNTPNTSPWLVSLVPPTSGGNTIKHFVCAGSANATAGKGSAGQLYGGWIYNNAAYPIYLKLHNNASTPTAGAGVVATVGVQAGVTVTIPAVQGAAFSTGIAFSIVKDIADAGTTATVASDCVGDLLYQ